MYGGWKFIHSNKFSLEASKKVSNILTKKIGATLKFERVEFGMFPPSTIFKNVQLIKEEKNKFGVNLSLEEFAVNFTYGSFFSSNLEIEELVLKSGTVKLNIVENPDEPDIEWRKLKIKKLFTQYQDIVASSPVKINLVKFEGLKAEINEFNFNIKNITISPLKKNLRAKFDVDELVIAKDLANLKVLPVKKLKFNLHASKDDIIINDLFIADINSSIKLNGKIYEDVDNLNSSLNININSKIGYLKSYLKERIKDFESFEGDVNLDVVMSGNIWHPNFDSEVLLENFKSEYINLLNVKASIFKRNHIVGVNKFKALNGKEEYSMVKPVGVFDLNKNQFIKSKAILNLKNAFTNTFLFAIKDSLDVLKGYVSGKVETVFDGTKVSFNIYEKLAFNNFKLILPKSTKPLLENSGFEVENSTITVDGNGTVGLNLKISLYDSLLKLNGVIDKKNINIISSDSKINLHAFGPISGIKIEGSGPIDLKVNGPLEDVRFDFNVNWKKFSLLDINFGDMKSHFTLGLSDLVLSVEKLDGKYNQSIYDVNGWLSFGDKSGIDLKLNFPNSNFQDAKNMYSLVFKGMKLPKDLDLKFETQYRVFGNYDLAELKIDGSLKGKELKVFNEDFDSAGFNFNLNNKNLNFTNLKIKKGRGEIVGSANISLANNYSEVEAGGSGIRLSDFNFYRKLNLSYDSDLSLEYDGNGTSDNYSSRLKFKTIDPFITTFPASNSNGLIYLSSSELVAKVNLLGSKVKIDSIYDFNTDQVVLKSAVDTQDLRELFGAISGHNILDKSISGVLKGNLNTKFNANTYDISKFNLEFKQFKLKRDEVDLKVDPTKNSISVEDGLVKKWDLAFYDGAEFFTSKGSNLVSTNGIVLDQNFNIKSNFLELVNGFVEKSRGNIRGSNQLLIKKGITFNFFKLSSNNGSLKFKNIPGFITNLNYDIVKNSNRFELIKLVGKYGEGEFRSNGYLVFNDLYPMVNLDFKIDKSIIPLFKKSNVLISGSGIVTGTELPYNLNGKMVFLQGDILDDPSDIMNEGKVSLDEFNKYLPLKTDGSSTGYLNLNIAFDTQNNISIKNNLSEIFLKAQGQVTGNLVAPEINAKFDVSPTISKFKFKGHDFILSQGNLEIHDKGKNRTSQLKFLGLAKVNDYDIKLDLSGKLDKVDINLSSEPVKSQEDILSLLTLGVTSDMNKNLDPTERSAITRIGIGTLFLNQFKINEDINNTIGVNVSVLPEFQEEDSSLIADGKSGVSSTTSSRLKSATRIKVNKKITNKLDVAVSSTVGGSIEQKQEMNANFNFNKNVSLQGVYEIKPAEDESTTTPTSLGVDLKFRWSF
jgi:translocation and assembly module TamB